jgi:hypothetical protein
VSRLTQRVGPTCTPAHARGEITDVAIAGDRAVWTTRYGGTTRVLGASIIDCVEWLLARPDPHVTRVAGLAGHGRVLAFALRRSRASAVGVVRDHWRTVPLARSITGVAAMAAEDRRVAVLHVDGRVAVLTRDGHVAKRFFAGADVRAIALQGQTLAVLRSGAVDVYRLGSDQPARNVSVPSNARSVDLQYGIVVVASGRDVVAANIETGRTVTLFRAPGKVAAQIEAPGAVVQYNIGGRGYLRFVPMSVIEARTA